MSPTTTASAKQKIPQATSTKPEIAKTFWVIRAASCDAPTHHENNQHSGATITTSDTTLARYLLMSHRAREPDWVQARRIVFCSISCATALTPRIRPKSGANAMPIPITTSFRVPLLETDVRRCSQNVALLVEVPPNPPLQGAERNSRHNDCSCRPMISVHTATTTASRANAITMERCWRHTTHISAHRFRSR